MALLPSLPMSRSPSQWPGMARSSTSAGRSEIMTLSAIGPQAPGQLAAQLATTLDVERLVDRLVRHPHLRVVGELGRQALRDLLRGPQAFQVAGHPVAQATACELAHLGAPGAAPRPTV